jgi:hypothetical protein
MESLDELLLLMIETAREREGRGGAGMKRQISYSGSGRRNTPGAS